MAVVKHRWKFLKEKEGKIVSGWDSSAWNIGEWRKETVRGLCEGLNCSRYIPQALGYVQGNVLAKVEVRGKGIHSTDKETWPEMRIIQTWEWTKEDSVALAVFAAEQVLEKHEEKYPKDDRPRKAIEAARTWLKSPTEENRSAAWSAAESAAKSAAESATWPAAKSAAWSAWSAAESAAKSAAKSAWSAAWAAAWAAASAKLVRNLHRFCVGRLKEKEGEEK